MKLVPNLSAEPFPSKLNRLLQVEETMKRLMNDIDDRGRQIALLLKQVYDEQLYLGTHDDFGPWYEHFFKKDRDRAWQLLKWANLPTIVGRESHARALSKCPPDMQAAVFKEAGGLSDATAARINEAIERKQIKDANEKKQAALAVLNGSAKPKPKTVVIDQPFHEPSTAQRILDHLDAAIELANDWDDMPDRLEFLDRVQSARDMVA